MNTTVKQIINVLHYDLLETEIYLTENDKTEKLIVAPLYRVKSYLAKYNFESYIVKTIQIAEYNIKIRIMKGDE